MNELSPFRPSGPHQLGNKSYPNMENRKPSRKGGNTVQGFSSREILTQLGLILEHPEEYVQVEKLPGQLSSHLLERYEHGNYEVEFRSSRNKYYLRRWFLSRVLTYGNIGENEKIISTIVFNGYHSMEQLFFFLIRRIKNRKTNLVMETYELCREIYPLYFPKLPDVQDPRTEPYFLVVVLRKRKVIRTTSNRVRNPSAVGGKHRQGISPLPMFPSGDPGPSNVEEIFLNMMNLLQQKSTLSV